MNEGPKPSSSRQEGRLPNKDIGPILKGWDYEPGALNVRKIRGNDGKARIQMRLDLGLLQMELTGRPDGRRPHGYESLLEYFESRLKAHKRRNGTDLGFHLTPDQCQSLRDEAVMYYHRYLSLFVLEDFDGVVRDTERNLRLLDLCAQFAEDEDDRLVLEQYRPYILMMNARSQASVLFAKQQYRPALRAVNEGIERIREFYVRFGHEKAFARSGEVKILKGFARDIRRQLPVDPIRRLQVKLQKAVRDERYEEAATLRDEINRKMAQRGKAGTRTDKK